jgi:small subunit ribosomal protein S6
MNHYEIVLMVHPDQSEQVSTIVGRYVDLIKAKGGVIHRQEDWGRKSLSYPINKLHKAHYILLNIELNVKDLQELTDAFRYNDFVLRYFVLSMKGAQTEPSIMMQPRKVYSEGDR